jgi:hypothetical protein
MMGSRFITNLFLALAAGFVAVASQAFAAGVTGWIAFGIGLGILAMLGIAQLDRTRGRLQQGLDTLAGLLGIWTVVASVVFSGATLTWLSLAEALAFVGLAVAGLVAHELSTERVVHAFAVEGARDETDSRRAEQYAAA